MTPNCYKQIHRRMHAWWSDKQKGEGAIIKKYQESLSYREGGENMTIFTGSKQCYKQIHRGRYGGVANKQGGE